MAIGRLLSPKSTPHFNIKGFVPLTRRLFSSSLEDGRRFERLPDSNASANKDIGEKGMHWYSLGGLLTNLKQKITGNMLLFNKTPPDGSVSPKPPMVSSLDATVTKVVSLQDVSENKKCIPPSVKEESLVSEMESQDASQSVAGIEVSGKRESASVNKESLGSNNSLDGLKVEKEKVLRLIQAERLDLPVEQSSKDVSLGLLTEEAPKSQGKLQPEKEQSDQRKPPQNSLSDMFINLHPDKEFKLRPRFEGLSNSSSSLSTGESCSVAGDQHGLFGKMPSDPVQKMKNDKHRFSDALQKPDSLSSFLLSGASHDRKSGDLTAVRERKTTYPFGSSRGTVAPVTVSRDLNMKKLMESLTVPTDNSNSWERNSVTNKSDVFRAKEEEESMGETSVMQNQSLCSQATMAATTANPELTKKSVDALSTGEQSRNKVVLRFLHGGVEKQVIVGSFSKFGAILDVQEIPSFKGCLYTDALLTFETNSAAEKALKKGVVHVNHFNVIVEATSQQDMVEKICIPDLIGDPDVPVALVKEPTRTVKIHPLAQDISSNQIKEALRFCGSDISKFIMGSSKTAAFLEFETEEGKERALAGHSISISNKQLFISRIDIPRTTVARISNSLHSPLGDIRKLCVAYGQINQVIRRGKDIADVRFDVSEWPNMLTILNGLNGKEIDGKKLVVRPATTVIPHEILKVLWEDPRGKRYVEDLIQKLVREIEQPLDATTRHTHVMDLLL